MPRPHPAAIGLLSVATVIAAAVVGWRLRTGDTDANIDDIRLPKRAAPVLEISLPGFEDQAQAAGLDFSMNFLPDEQGEKFKVNLYDHGCGVAVADYDGDGRDDVFFLNQLGPNALYRNRGDGTFENVTARAGSIGLDDRVCVGATFADFDNDGDQDLYATSTRGGSALFRNDGGRFHEVTASAGLELVGHSQTAAAFDYDNDGYLDLFLTNSAAWTTNEFNEDQRFYSGLSDFPELFHAPKEFNVMYRNRGDGTFENVTERVGLTGQGWSGDVAVFDFDADGRLDLLVTNMFGLSQLYRNGDDGVFRDAAAETLGVVSYGTIGAKAFDYNNDGLLDLFVSDMHSDMWMADDYDLRMIDPTTKYPTMLGAVAEPTAAQLDMMTDILPLADRIVFGNTLFKNLGDGRFEECSHNANMETFWPWGVATGDFDNDGNEDVFIPSGMGYPFDYWPNSLMMNVGDGTFRDRAAVRGIEPPANGLHLPESIGGKPAARSSRCAAVADFDGNGRLEIVTNNFNDAPYYFQNRFPQQDYIAFRLIGTKSNRDAVGAVARCHLGGQILTRQVHAAGGYLSQSSKTLHFGLGKGAQIDRVEIQWPSGQTQTIEAPEPNRLHEVTEPE